MFLITGAGKSPIGILTLNHDPGMDIGGLLLTKGADVLDHMIDVANDTHIKNDTGGNRPLKNDTGGSLPLKNDTDPDVPIEAEVALHQAPQQHSPVPDTKATEGPRLPNVLNMTASPLTPWRHIVQMQNLKKIRSRKMIWLRHPETILLWNTPLQGKIILQLALLAPQAII